jgi:predicted NAD-dependent protein-ADP-ribosyltransferase YbiA (DUF1768 family)
MFGHHDAAAEILKEPYGWMVWQHLRGLAFDYDVWRKAVEAVVMDGVLLLCAQKEKPRSILIKTSPKQLYLSTDGCRLMGTGVALTEPALAVFDPSFHDGANAYGRGLMHARERLLAERQK